MSQNTAAKTVTIAAVQMTSSSDKESNKSQATSLILRAKELGAKVIYLPECLDYVSEIKSKAVEESETLDGELITYYKCLAKENGLWLSLGGFHEKGPEGENRVYNSHVMINDGDEIKGLYRKTHLFDVDIKDGIRLKETDFTIPGDTIGPPVNTPCGNVGLGICYDLRFTELSTSLIQQGAEILTYPSAFTVPTGKAHWEVLLRSRAIENQCYVVAAAQVGQHNKKRVSYGHAMIVDPWGKVLGDCGENTGVITAEIDLSYLVKRREEMPIKNHRRHDLYGHVENHQGCDIDIQDVYTFGQYSVKSSSVFYRTALTYAFVNRKPVIDGHVLVSPIRRTNRFSDLTPSEVSDLWNVSQKVALVLEKVHNKTSSTLCIQDGKEAGQTVDHVHVHILPRGEGDFKQNDDIYDKLESHDKNVKEVEWRTDEDMAVEAGKLRSVFK